MRNKLHSRLVRWALGKHLLITVMAVSRWLWSAVTFPPGGARGDRGTGTRAGARASDEGADPAP